MDCNSKYRDPLQDLDPDDVANIIRDHANQVFTDSEYAKAQAAQPEYHPVIYEGVFNTAPSLRTHAKKRKVGKLQRKARRLNRKKK